MLLPSNLSVARRRFLCPEIGENQLSYISIASVQIMLMLFRKLGLLVTNLRELLIMPQRLAYTLMGTYRNLRGLNPQEADHTGVQMCEPCSTVPIDSAWLNALLCLSMVAADQDVDSSTSQ